MLGALGGQGQNMMTMSIQELMLQNYNQTLESGEKEILEIFKDVKVGDAMIGYMTGNYQFLDNQQMQIRESLNNQIRAQSLDTLTNKIVDSFLPMFTPTPQYQNLVKEGVAIHQLARNSIVSLVTECIRLIVYN